MQPPGTPRMCEVRLGAREEGGQTQARSDQRECWPSFNTTHPSAVHTSRVSSCGLAAGSVRTLRKKDCSWGSRRPRRSSSTSSCTSSAPATTARTAATVHPSTPP
eukprot:1511323-Rhodomonas_salina.2